MPGTTKNTFNNVQGEFEAALKAKKPLAKHMWMLWDRYVGRIMDTRFEVTTSRLNFVSFDMKMEINLQDMEVVAPFSFDKDIHNKSRFGKFREGTMKPEGSDHMGHKYHKKSTGKLLQHQGR